MSAVSAWSVLTRVLDWLPYACPALPTVQCLNMSSSDLNFAVRWIKGECWALKLCDAVVLVSSDRQTDRDRDAEK